MRTYTGIAMALRPRNDKVSRRAIEAFPEWIVSFAPQGVGGHSLAIPPDSPQPLVNRVGWVNLPGPFPRQTCA